MAFDLHSFCPELWSQIEIDAQGDFKICCLANHDKDFGMAMDEEGNVMNVLTHSIQEAMNSKTHRDHRLLLKQNIRPKRCASCYDSEQVTNGTESKRQSAIMLSNGKIPEYVNVDNADSMTNEDGTIRSNVVVLDLRFGNLCNYKCVMCSPQHSNQWYDDWIALGNEHFNKGLKKYSFEKDEHGRYQMDQTRWWEFDIWWKQFDEIAPQIRKIYFTGGEPLLVPAMQKILDILIERGLSKNIMLRYDTNLSVINPKVIDKWKQFRKNILCVSIDDTFERYNLIRNPGNYERFIENIKTIKEHGHEIRYISSCIGIATPYAIQRVLQVADELNVRTFFRFLEGPYWLDIRILPRKAKEKIIRDLKAISDVSPEHHKKWYDSEIKILAKYINHEDKAQLELFVKNMDILDKQRKTNWKKTLPDVYDLLVNYCGVELDKVPPA